MPITKDTERQRLGAVAPTLPPEWVLRCAGTSWPLVIFTIVFRTPANQLAAWGVRYRTDNSCGILHN